MKDKKDKLKIYKKTSNPICNGVTGIKFNLLPKSAKRVEKIIKKKRLFKIWKANYARLCFLGEGKQTNKKMTSVIAPA